MAISVKLEAFEGPMDLLLHLIDINKIDIYDIPIAEITDQYLSYLKEMQKEDMNVTSEFLVMAATLLDIKCRMLLPKEVDESGEEIDPREDLVEKLLEYKMYKYMSFALRDREEDASGFATRGKFLPKEVKEYQPPIDYEELIGDKTLGELHAIFTELMKRKEERVDPVRSHFGTIEKEEVDMNGKVKHVRDSLLKNRRTSFRALLEKTGSKAELVVTFLVVLEMIKTGDLLVTQDENFGDITIEVKDPDHLKEIDPDKTAAAADGGVEVGQE